uniref:Lipoprotein n=1 Tax=Panagrellus redivivus TaxID=6233 RepID=A0A7E4W369_PANRE
MKHPWICFFYLGILQQVVMGDDTAPAAGENSVANVPPSTVSSAPDPTTSTTTVAPMTRSPIFNWQVLTVNGISSMYRVISVPSDIRALAIENNFCSFLHPNAKPASIHDEKLNTELTSRYKDAAIGLYVPRNSDILKWQDGSVVDYFPMQNGTEGHFFDVNRPARYVRLGADGWVPITTEKLETMLCEISNDDGGFGQIKK